MIIFAEGPVHDMLLEVARRGIDAAGFQYPKTAAVLRGNKLAAIAVYHSYAPPDIQMSFYALTPRWAHRSTIRDLLAYPFVQLGVRRITALVKKNNKRSRRMVEGFGWKLEGTIRKGARDGRDLMLYGMLAEEFGERYGHIKSTLSAAGRPAAGIGQVFAAPAAGREAGDGSAHPAGAGEPDRRAPGLRAGSAPAGGRVEPPARDSAGNARH